MNHRSHFACKIASAEEAFQDAGDIERAIGVLVLGRADAGISVRDRFLVREPILRIIRVTLFKAVGCSSE